MHSPEVDIPEEVAKLLNLTKEEEKARAEELKTMTEVERWRRDGSPKSPKITQARAISLHTHPNTKYGIKSMLWFEGPMRKYLLGREQPMEEIIARAPSDDEWVEPRFRRYGVRATPIAWDDETQHAEAGLGTTSNDYIAWLCKKYPDVFPTGWAMVDPHRGKLALVEMERAVKELGLIGVKFQQAAQRFVPSDKQWYPMWDFLQDLGVPVQLHCGYTGVGGGPPGGLGVNPLHFTNPYWIDFVLSDFPRLNIIGCHPAWPFEDIARAVCLHKGNFFREISGLLPKYFPPNMLREMNTRLKDKFMFGCEIPAFQMDELLRQHAMNNYRPGVWDKLMWANAERILGIPRDPSKDKPEWPSKRELRLKRWFTKEEENYYRLDGVEFYD